MPLKGIVFCEELGLLLIVYDERRPNRRIK